MGKRLYSSDYDQIVLKTFSNPESDFKKYYLNVVEDYYSINDDIFQELISAIHRRIEWYRKQHLQEYERDPGFTGSDFDTDYNGKLIRMDPDKTSIPILHLNIEGNIYSHINKSFFDEQIRIVQALENEHRLRNTVTKLKFQTINQLLTKLSFEQRSDLFNSLVKGKFISETNKESFIWAFGKVGEVQPLRWEPIKWMAAKQGLRELLKPILGTITNQHVRDIENLFVGKDCKPFKMSKDKEFSTRYIEIEAIVKSLNIENIPTDSEPI